MLNVESITLVLTSSGALLWISIFG